MSLNPLVREVALNFLKAYAIDHQFFTGGDVLEAFRKTGLPGSEIDWRNKWGAVISEGAKRAWYVKAGRTAPITLRKRVEGGWVHEKAITTPVETKFHQKKKKEG